MAEDLLSQELASVVLERYPLLIHAIKEELEEGQRPFFKGNCDNGT